MTTEQLAEVLRLHGMWLRGENGGEMADLRGADLSSVNLAFVALRGADLADANLVGTDLTYADLRGANLSSANLARADLTGAVLKGAVLTRAVLSDANLTYANLVGTDLTYANLCEANLSSANLTRAVLSDADLTYANLCEANMSGANLSSANLARADLRWVNLHGVDRLLPGDVPDGLTVEIVKKCDELAVVSIVSETEICGWDVLEEYNLTDGGSRVLSVSLDVDLGEGDHFNKVQFQNLLPGWKVMGVARICDNTAFVTLCKGNL